MLHLLKPLTVSALALSLAIGLACAATHQGTHAAHDEADESDERDGKEPSVEVIRFSDLPEPVRKAFLGIASESSVTRVERETEEGMISFEVEYTGGSVTITNAGEVMEIEQPLDQTHVPSSVLRGIEEELPHATVEKVQLVRHTYYECKIRVDGKAREVNVELSGKMEEAD